MTFAVDFVYQSLKMLEFFRPEVVVVEEEVMMVVFEIFVVM
jgi:hypothetical protein